MQLRYDEDFVEAAALFCASGKRPGIPALQIRRFHAEREKCYSVVDSDERNAAFFKLHLEWFREWGLEKVVAGLVNEFTLLPGALNVLAFRKARSKNEEGAELYVQSGAGATTARSDHPCAAVGAGASVSDERPAGTGDTPVLLSRNAVVALRVERFENDSLLPRFLRHEFTHLNDMVDLAFGYSSELRLHGPVPTPQRVVRDRYRLLWDITIDGRLSRGGCEIQTVRELYETLFSNAYSFWPDTKRREVFDELWTSDAPRHARLLEMASDPRGLAHTEGPIPGGSCPLCGFPTFEWANLSALTAQPLEALRAQFPDWTPAQGACKRCLEIYESAGQMAFPPTICL